MEVLLQVLVFLLFLPILMAVFWWISLPLYYGLLALEVWRLYKAEEKGADARPLMKMVDAQALLPFTYLLLYPFMPGSTATGEPLGLNEKAYLAFSAMLALVLIGFALFAWKLRTQKKLAQHARGVERRTSSGVPTATQKTTLPVGPAGELGFAVDAVTHA